MRGNIVLASVALLILAGCVTNAQRITGDPILYGVDQVSGKLVDRDIATGGTTFHKNEIITVVLNSVFIRLLEQFQRSHVLVYAEVYDDATDDPDKAYRKVLFNSENTPAGVNLGVSDRVLYGPTAYKGHPIRVRFFVVQLAKDQKKLASRIFNAAGTVGQAALPAGAAVVGAALQIAQTLNELAEDDFEMRFDMTLYPVAGAAKWDIGDDTLARFNAKNNSQEPNQRQGKSIHMLTPLRAGSYVILKRELSDRVKASAAPDDECARDPAVDFDHAQEGLFRSFRRFEDRKQRVTAQIAPRYSGGSLYWYVMGPENNLEVITCENPDHATTIGPGYRYLYRTQTYATFTVLNGLPLGLSEEQMRAGSDRDLKQIRSLLDNPDQLSPADRLGPALDQAVNAVKTAIESRRITVQAARRVSADPGFRKDTQYPVFWTEKLVDKTDTDSKNLNAAVLATLGDIVLNLPSVAPDEIGAIRCLKQLGKDGFETVATQPGLFNLKAPALSQVKSGSCGAAASATKAVPATPKPN